MERLNIFVSQWQGSGITEELFEGAHVLKDYIKDKFGCNFTGVEIDRNKVLEVKNNILGFDQIRAQLLGLQRLIDEHKPETIFTVGGGCGVEIPVVSYLNETYSDLSVFWFDAHGDLNSPDSSVSKHFHGMPVRFLCDQFLNFDGLRIVKVPHKNISLIGTRDLDPPEAEYIRSSGIRLISVDDVIDKKLLQQETERRREKAYIHIDLDVIDPAYYRNVKCPTENGLSIKHLYESIKLIKKSFDVVGFSIVENTEKNYEEIMKLDSIIGSCLSSSFN